MPAKQRSERDTLAQRIRRVLLVFAVSWNLGQAANADPFTTITRRVSASNCDAEQLSNGTMTLTGLSLDVGTQAWVGMRFTNITIPAGATITNATLTFRSNNSYTAQPAAATIFAEAADNSAVFTTTANNLSARSLTTATYAIPYIPSYALDVDLVTPDISAMIQEVVSRTGWASGNSLSILIRADAAGQRGMYGYDGSTSYAPLLTIEYTPFARPTAPNLLYVVSNATTPNAQELKREEWLKWWAYKVTRIAANDSQVNYDTAINANDVAYVPETITSSDLNTKLKLARIGVVIDEPAVVDDFQISNSLATTGSATFSTTNNTHYITSPFTLGAQALFTSTYSSQEIVGTLGKEVVPLGSFAGGNPGLATVEAGGILADATKAFGRRVTLPWAASADFNYLTSDGQTMMRRALAWAAGLEAHWKFDETSGTAAADSGPNAYTGTVTGTAAWSASKLSNGLQLNGSTYMQATGLIGNLKNITIAAWANLTAKDSGGAELVSLGDHIVIRLDEGSATRAFIYNGSTWVGISTNTTYLGTGWHHFAAVFDDDNNVLNLYVDGVLKSTYSTTASIGYTGIGSNTQIGRHGNGGTTYDFTGKIDDVRIYNYALSAGEVTNLRRLNQPRGVRVTKWVETQ